MADYFDPNKAAGEIASALANSLPVQNLLGPLTNNFGGTLGLLSEIANFYAEENLTRIFEKWAKQRKQKPLNEAAFKRVLPLLREAVLQSDDDMQERWAALLENTANAEDGVLPSFGQTLSQLSPAEARYIDRIWDSVDAPKEYSSGRRDGRDELSPQILRDIYDPMLRPPSPAEMRVYRNRMSPEQIAAYEKMTNFELMLHDLERLRILEKEVQYALMKIKYTQVESSEIGVPTDIGSKTSYSLTQYGVSFIKAVRPKEPSEE